MPKWSALASQPEVARNSAPYFAIAGQASQAIWPTIQATLPPVAHDIATHMPRKARSEVRSITVGSWAAEVRSRIIGSSMPVAMGSLKDQGAWIEPNAPDPACSDAALSREKRSRAFSVFETVDSGSGT